MQVARITPFLQDQAFDPETAQAVANALVTTCKASLGLAGEFRAVPLRSTVRSMGFNKRKLEDQRRTAAEKEAASRRATDPQVLEDAERLITAWNERQANKCRCCSRQPSVLP